MARLRTLMGSIRGRTTAVAVAVVGVALLAGSVALVSIVRATLTDSVLADIRIRADELAGDLAAGTPPAALRFGDADDLLVQVLDADGAVVASSPRAGTAPIARLPPGSSMTIDVPGDDDPFLAVAMSAPTPGGTRLRIVVARTLDLVVESTDLVTTLLVIGLPLLLGVVGVTAWMLVGRALAPVEALRAEVDRISSADLGRRVSDPPGRDEIARLAQTMNRMLARLEQAHQRQRQLVADTSHELRSPIAVIRQHAEVALAHPSRTTLEELAGTVLAEDLRLARLVDDLLLLARIQDGSAASLQAVDLDDLVFEEAARVRAARRVEMDTSTVSGGRVRGSAADLDRVVRNLIENAGRHARSRVAVALETLGPRVRLRVDDDGPGIGAADRQRVFDRFVRLDAARARDDGGMGLGLAIVREVVESVGGSVEINDSPLGGARFTVDLPASDG